MQNLCQSHSQPGVTISTCCHGPSVFACPQANLAFVRCCNLYHRDEISSLKYNVTALTQHWHKDENRMWSWGLVAFFPAVSPS